MLKRVIIIVLLILVALSLLALGHFFLQHNSALRFKQVLLHYHGLFALWRYGLYAIMLICWPYFIVFMGKRQNWQRETVVYLSNQRLKLFGLFAIIELFFIHNGIGHIMTWL
jgi:hypothetical protein